MHCKMSFEVALMDLKIQLKKWEMNFMKRTGQKPSQQDISCDEKAKILYVEYARLKKKLSSASSKSPSPNASAVATSVWGTGLLKANSNASDVQDHLEHIEKPSGSKETPILSYRDKVRKNISLSQVNSLPLSLKKPRKCLMEEVKGEKNSVKASHPVHSQNCIELERLNDESSFVISSAMSIAKPKFSISQTYKKQKDYFPHIQKLSSFKKKSCTVSWLNENSDDLSDLINLKNKITMEEKENSDDTDGTQSQKNSEHGSNVSQERTVLKPLCEISDSKKDICDDTVIDVHTLQTKNTSSDLLFKSTNAVCESKENCKTTPSKTNLDETSTSDLKESCTLHTNTVSSSKLVSQNFVRINMQQKSFSRKGGKGRFLRKQVYRDKLAKKGFTCRSGWKGRSGGSGKSGFVGRSEDKCFKCGENGHWASKCKNKAKFVPKSNLTLEEDENLVSVNRILEDCHPLETSEVCSQSSRHVDNNIELKQADPVYQPDDCDSIEVVSILKKFGYSAFRPGQEKAIKRILCGESTLIVLSTGLGKSLCYQLPAYLYSLKRCSITLVISPLVSLMDDQVSGLPKFLKAACLHSGMTKEQKEKILTDVQAAKVDILLVSPETLTSWAGLSSQFSPLSKLPPISFVCVDECHCLAEWSHSFRPSYLRICQVLKDQLGVKCLVGLTATATHSSCNSIAKQLGIKGGDEGIVMNMLLPENLLLSVSSDAYKDEALYWLLTGERFKSLDSIIIYCTRREECARLSSYLRTRLHHEATDGEVPPVVNDVAEEPAPKKRKRCPAKGKKQHTVAWEVDCYHAGMSTAERRRVQNKFMKGKLRIVVATVAFGMGIDKQDVRTVIHYNMPRSFERYVQEVGRAGRDGLTAHCHLLLDSDGADLSELRRHSYGKTVDRYIVQQLVKKVFPSCACPSVGEGCKGHLAAVPIDPTVDELDLSKEGIETLLCYLEMESLIKVYLPTTSKCYIHCYEGAQQMSRVAKKCHAVALALANEGKSDKYGNEIEFSLVQVANQLSISLFALKRNLRNLMWDTTLSSSSESGKSGVTVDFREPSFLIHGTKPTTNEFLDDITDSLHHRIVDQERKELAQLQVCFDTMKKFSLPNVDCCKDKFKQSRSDELKQVINQYFKDDDSDQPPFRNTDIDQSTEDDVRSTIRQFLCVHGTDLGSELCGRAIARIFHGIESPKYPAKSWGRARRFWRSKINVDFNSIIKIATSELVRFL